MKLTDQIDYIAGQRNAKVIVSDNNGMAVLMAFDKGIVLGTHTTHAHVLVQILEGKCDFTVKGNVQHMSAGDYLLMEPDTEHSLAAPEQFKVLVTKINA